MASMERLKPRTKYMIAVVISMCVHERTLIIEATNDGSLLRVAFGEIELEPM